jgi:hypothetical protein
MKVATLDRRVAALEQRRIYRIASLADLVVLLAWRQRGDPRAPRAEDVEWDPIFEDSYDRCMKRRPVDEAR